MVNPFKKGDKVKLVRLNTGMGQYHGFKLGGVYEVIENDPEFVKVYSPKPGTSYSKGTKNPGGWYPSGFKPAAPAAPAAPKRALCKPGPGGLPARIIVGRIDGGSKLSAERRLGEDEWCYADGEAVGVYQLVELKRVKKPLGGRARMVAP